MSPSQMAIARLSLNAQAHACAVAIAQQHPDVVFTSGRRTRDDQARAMARNIVQDREFRAANPKTKRKPYLDIYLAHTVIASIKRWLREHPKAVTAAEIEHGLKQVFAGMTDTEMTKLSRHFSGNAFDIAPVDGMRGQMILATIKREVSERGARLIENEGGVRVWHVQF